MTAASVVDAPAISTDVAGVRRWARRYLWAQLLFIPVGAIAVMLTPPTTSEPTLDVLFAVTAPVFAALEGMLLFAVYRAFSSRARLLTALVVAAGVASIATGLPATLLLLTGNDTLESALTSAATGLTAAELVLFGALLKSASATPPRLWVLGALTGIGVVAAEALALGGPDLLLLPAVLLLSYPFFLYQLGNLAVPPIDRASS